VPVVSSVEASVSLLIVFRRYLVTLFLQALETVEMCSENALNLEPSSSESCYICLISITRSLYSMVQGSLDSR